MQTARRSGITSIGVSWGYGDIEAMERAGAAAIAHDTEELLTLLEKYRNNEL